MIGKYYSFEANNLEIGSLMEKGSAMTIGRKWIWMY